MVVGEVSEVVYRPRGDSNSTIYLSLPRGIKTSANCAIQPHYRETF